MSRSLKGTVAIAILVLMFAACSRNEHAEPQQGKAMNGQDRNDGYRADTAIDAANTPEDVYRRFMLANLAGDEAAIRGLIVEHKEAAILWERGGYPKDVAALLAKQYRTMEIVRVKAPTSDGEAKTVELQSSASQIPLSVVRVGGIWKVDAGPIIEFRKAASNRK